MKTKYEEIGKEEEVLIELLSSKTAQTFSVVKDISDRCPVTDLMQRGRFVHDYNALGRASSDKVAIAFAFVEVDNFKRVNDNFDHAFGDKILRDIAAVLSETVSPFEMPEGIPSGARKGIWATEPQTYARAYRRSGDEFYCLIIGIGKEITLNICKSILSDVSRLTREHPQKGTLNVGDVTVSIGLVFHQGNTVIDADTLENRSDIAMSHAKKQKNTIVEYTEGMEALGDGKRQNQICPECKTSVLLILPPGAEPGSNPTVIQCPAKDCHFQLSFSWGGK